jgi:hypothetical protein
MEIRSVLLRQIQWGEGAGREEAEIYRVRCRRDAGGHAVAVWERNVEEEHPTSLEAGRV